uniref:AarF domain-containing protein kinase 4 isoform X2 n=1 Tax=Rhizophora mucronata TaxID=61149 RepID=A0A2P2JEN8_RHIMU
MSSFNRLLNGLSLVAKEMAKRSGAAVTADALDLETLIASSAKKALVSATDLTGLTKGKVHEFSPTRPKESVVYFDHSAEPGPAQSQPVSDGVNDDVVAVEESVVEMTQVSKDDNVGDLTGELEDRKLKDRGKAGGQEVAAASTAEPKRRKPRERRVPSTPFSRALGFAGLGAGLAWGTVQESAKRLAFGTQNLPDKQSALSPFLSDKNAERLALALCRMRGAALKIGQMLSIQDESLVPAPV